MNIVQTSFLNGKPKKMFEDILKCSWATKQDKSNIFREKYFFSLISLTRNRFFGFIFKLNKYLIKLHKLWSGGCCSLFISLTLCCSNADCSEKKKKHLNRIY